MKRVGSNWIPKLDDGGGVNGGVDERDVKFSGREYVDDGFKDFDPEGSKSPLKDHSPIHSMDNLGEDKNSGHDRDVYFHRNGDCSDNDIPQAYRRWII
ncbi:hypothetical protein U1Q18_034064 [Sarracenia purpurea var. burkii]